MITLTTVEQQQIITTMRAQDSIINLQAALITYLQTIIHLLLEKHPDAETTEAVTQTMTQHADAMAELVALYEPHATGTAGSEIVQ